MGLLDVLKGMQNGPRGERQPGSGGSGSGSGGMSPLTMALLGLLAYKAYKHYSGQANAGTPGGPGSSTAPEDGGATGGGLGDLLRGGLGNLLASGAAGGILSNGLNDLIKQFEETGHGDVARSWVGTGPNKSISPDELEHAIGSDKVKSLAEQAGLSRLELLSGLSKQLPQVVDQLTPHGRVPSEEEMSRMV